MIDVNYKNDSTQIGSASHKGYEKNFGCNHRREIYLNKEDNKLKGFDHITKKVTVFKLDMYDFI